MLLSLIAPNNKIDRDNYFLCWFLFSLTRCDILYLSNAVQPFLMAENLSKLNLINDNIYTNVEYVSQCQHIIARHSIYLSI